MNYEIFMSFCQYQLCFTWAKYTAAPPSSLSFFTLPTSIYAFVHIEKLTIKCYLQTTSKISVTSYNQFQ